MKKSIISAKIFPRRVAESAEKGQGRELKFRIYSASSASLRDFSLGAVLVAAGRAGQSVVQFLSLRQPMLCVIRHFVINPRKCLSINNLQPKSCFRNPAQSCLIVPNRVIFHTFLYES
jgi:hypothetical protein